MDGNSWKKIDADLLPRGFALSSGQVKRCVIGGKQFEITIVCHQDGLGVGYTELLGRPIVEPAVTELLKNQ